VLPIRHIKRCFQSPARHGIFTQRKPIASFPGQEALGAVIASLPIGFPPIAFRTTVVHPMTIESPSVPVWRVRQLVQFAYDLAGVGNAVVMAEQPIDDVPLCELWQAVRDLSDDWQRRLQRLSRHREARWARTWCDDLNRLGHEIFAAELLLRIWGTMLAAQDRQREGAGARPILDHVVFHVQHARSKVLELVMHAGDPVAALDRFRRRCERWTDVLIGPILAQHGAAMFAHEARRAWEFGEELLTSEMVPGTDQLREAGFRTAFADICLDTPATPGWQLVIEAVLNGCDINSQTQLAHWRTAAMPESRREPAIAEVSASDETEGWSLLTRCLRIAENRQATDA